MGDLKIRRPQDGLVLVYISDDLVDLVGAVTEPLQRSWNGLVDDRHRAATDKLLRLHKPEVRLDPRRVAVHEERDRARRCQHRRLGIAHAMSLRQIDCRVPGLMSGTETL